MATVLELIDAEIEAFHSNVETGSLDDKSPTHSRKSYWCRYVGFC
jgi:hypothetical protein